MVGQTIPWIMGIGAILVGFRFWGSEFIENVIKEEIRDNYDVIIVGAGTSGSALAARLTEDIDREVLVIEAGTDPADHPFADIPIFADKMRNTEFDWGYSTVPQRHACKANRDQTAKWAAGKGLGGTSLLNYMLYLRGSRHDYDEWANNGAQNWAYKDVLPYFIKSEDNRNPQYIRTVFHGFGGLMTVKDIQLSPVTNIMVGAFKELNVKKRDINGKNQFGYGPCQATIRSGQRWGPKKAFLERAMQRDNLQVEEKAVAQKILFEGKKASGVMFVKDGKPYTVRAKEVVLAAGTVGTTKLMLLSGLGPRSHLQALKIPVIMDLPVGDNLQDHVVAPPVEFFARRAVSITPIKAENFRSSWAYSLWGGGLKQSPRFREGTAYVKTKFHPAHLKYPMIGLEVVANLAVYSANDLNLKDRAWEALFGNSPTDEGFSILPRLMHPRSKGTIRLKSANPTDPPLINPNYLAEDADVKQLAEAVHFTRKIANTNVMLTWDFTLNNNLLPECSKFGNFTSTYLECLVRHVTLPGNSPVGTCRMGAKGDPTAVVDPQLRVRGVKNLRIVDASVIPSAITGNTYATQVMIAEKAADMIRGIDSVERIREYFKSLIAAKHEKIREDEADAENKTANKKA